MDNFNLDHNREERTGFPEIVFGASKNISDIQDIIRSFIAKDKNVLITKLQKKKAKKLKEKYPLSFYDKVSRIFMLRPLQEITGPASVGILSAGTSDLYVASEAYYTLAYLGIKAEKISDIGVAGMHRITDRIDELKKFRILIVIAGFEGALPTVVGGLLPQPIIAVPTDVGYGVTKKGNVALKAMLTSCANGITVVNINNGYGAAMSAFRIINMFKNND